MFGILSAGGFFRTGIEILGFDDMIKTMILTRYFYIRDPMTVCRDLVGAWLCREMPDGGIIRARTLAGCLIIIRNYSLSPTRYS